MHRHQMGTCSKVGYINLHIEVEQSTLCRYVGFEHICKPIVHVSIYLITGTFYLSIL